MSSLANAIKIHASSFDRNIPANRYATILSVDPDNHMASVLVHPEEIPLKWIPYDAMGIGGGVTITSPPNVGDQVIISPMSNDGFEYHISSRSPNLNALPAKSLKTGKPAQPGEFLIDVPGFQLHIANNTVYLYGNFELHGNMLVYGNINSMQENSSGGDISDRHGSVDRLRQNYDNHKHTGVKAGSDTSYLTTNPDSE